MADILTDLAGVTIDDTENVRQFVSAWGKLGAGFPLPGLPGAALLRLHPEEWLLPYDGVADTKAWIRDIQKVGVALRGGPVPPEWDTLAARLRGITEEVSLKPETHGGAHRFVLEPRRLLDLLVLELWLVAAEERALGACEWCGRWIIRPKTGQRWCSEKLRPCSNQHSVAVAKIKKRVLDKAAAGTPLATITRWVQASQKARRAQIGPADVRAWVRARPDKGSGQ